MKHKSALDKSDKTTTALLALLSFCVGAANVIAFAPMALWPVQIISVAVLFYLLSANSMTPGRAALLSFSFSLGWLSAAVSWLTIAMTRFGNLPWWLAILALLLLCGFLSTYYGICAYLAQRFFARESAQVKSWWYLLLVLPAFWEIAEALRVYLFTGFPWAISGYAHTQSPLSGYAPVLGVLGIGWLNAVLAASLVWLLRSRSGRSRLGSLSLIASILIAGFSLKQVQWTVPEGQAIQVRLLQGNIAQDLKFQSDYLNHSLALYFDLLTKQAADLSVTPETALPILSSQLPPDYLPALRQFATQKQTTLMLGVAAHDGGSHYANSLLGMSANYAQRDYRYDKSHLVPFGEFIPPGFDWFVKAMQIPMSDFTRPATLQAPLLVGQQAVQPNICYEDLFGEEIARELRAQLKSQESGARAKVAGIMLNTSNLAWYGDSWAIDQHLQISQMRALEMQRPMLRATNTGATAHIAHDGRVLARLPSNQAGVLTVSVQGRKGATPYIYYGNSSIALIILSLLIIAGYWQRIGRSKKTKTSSR